MILCATAEIFRCLLHPELLPGCSFFFFFFESRSNYRVGFPVFTLRWAATLGNGGIGGQR